MAGGMIDGESEGGRSRQF